MQFLCNHSAGHFRKYINIFQKEGAPPIRLHGVVLSWGSTGGLIYKSNDSRCDVVELNSAHRRSLNVIVSSKHIAKKRNIDLTNLIQGLESFFNFMRKDH